MDDKKWYSGKYDRAFKEVMLKESNRDLLTMLLEHILKIKINNITILNVEKLMSNVHIRGQRLDLNLETDKGKINVEVNSSYNKYIPNRNFAFITDIYSHDVLVGDKYKLNTQYIQINLSYGLNKSNKTITIYKMMDKDGNCFITNFTIYEINMDYYTNLINNTDTNKIKDDIILVMLGQERKDLQKLSKNNKVVSKYMKELDEVNENPEFREYMSYEKDQELLRNTEREIGREEGIEQGKQEGKVEGKQELMSQLIDSFLSKGMSNEEIKELLNLTEEEIMEIRDKK